MKVELAGMNVPIVVLDEIMRISENAQKEGKEISPGVIKNALQKLTPEAISAGYARISRSKKDVDELIIEAINNIEKARKSNESIIYGMGHHSVADHIIFNLNIKGVSRLEVENIEKRRIAGYTEKSQRYIVIYDKSFDGEYIVPEEYSPEDAVKFEALVKTQNKFYVTARKKILSHLKEKNSTKIAKLEEDDKKNFLSKLKAGAKEDARFALSLATKAQLGCSYTGQTAELAIRESKFGPLAEDRQFTQLLYDEIVNKAPSIIQLTDAELFKQHNPGKELEEDNFKFTRNNLREITRDAFERYKPEKDDIIKGEGMVTYLPRDNVDKDIIAGILFANSDKSYAVCDSVANQIVQSNQGEEFVKKALKYLGAYDKLPRETELSSGLAFEIITSASCFAQAKRHRIDTLIPQEYNIDLGYMIPQNIKEAGLEKELVSVCDQSSELHEEFRSRYGKAADYCLTNAHMRRIILSANMRQWYHISRTREDEHAQWEIRARINEVTDHLRNIAPITSILLGGKHEFLEIREKVYGNKE